MRSPLGEAPTTDEGSAGAFEVSWFWDWVPGAESDATERSAWRKSVAGVLDDWVGEKVAAARAAWPADAAQEFPFTVEEMGAAVAGDLLERADDVPANCLSSGARGSSATRRAGCRWSSWPSSARPAPTTRPT